MTENINIRKIKVQHFKNLVAVAYSDGYYDEIERDFLAEKAVEYGLTTEIVSGILSHAEDLQFIVPENTVDSEEQLTDVVYMAIIDGVLRAKEYELCVSIAKKLGFNKEYVDDVIIRLKKIWNDKQEN
ncbi:MAG: hypothetical protein M3512_05965 [Bacteroidota bacterium]|nr:hypothetical protein [Bacteroidota bacterium]